MKKFAWIFLLTHGRTLPSISGTDRRVLTLFIEEMLRWGFDPEEISRSLVKSGFSLLLDLTSEIFNENMSC